MAELKIAAVVLLVIGFATPSLAHHGFITNPVLYHADSLVEVEGEVTGVFWRNPHPLVRIENDDGEEWDTVLLHWFDMTP